MKENLISTPYDDTILVDLKTGFIYKKGYWQSKNKVNSDKRFVQTYRMTGTAKSGYVYHTVNKKIKRFFIGEHRIVMSAFIGRILDKNEIVDHVNNIRNDNRISNLRIVTSSENQKNISKVYAERFEINSFNDEELKTEIFKTLSDFYSEFNDRKGEHFISNLGRLKYYNRRKKEWIIKNPYLTSNTQKYPIYDFSLGKFGRHNIMVHKMVMKCFIGNKPEGDIVIDHIDNNPQNTRLGNLQYITRTENTQIAFSSNDYQINTQTQGQSKDYTKDDINNILHLFYVGNKSLAYLQKKFNHNRITEILKGRTYKNLYDEKWNGIFLTYNEVRDKNSKIARTQKRENYKRKNK